MRPAKRLFPIAIWLMRIAVVLFVFTNYWNVFNLFNFQSVMFYVSALFIIFSSLLFIGGFLYKSSLTVLSSFILILVTGYISFINLKSDLDHNFAMFVLLGSIFVFFLTTGNKRL